MARINSGAPLVIAKYPLGVRCSVVIRLRIESKEMCIRDSSYNLQNPEILSFIKHHYSTVTFADELKPENLLNEEATKASEDGMPVINTCLLYTSFWNRYMKCVTESLY